MKFLGIVPSWAYALAIGMLIAFAGLQTLRLSDAGVTIAEERATRAKEDQQREEVARLDTERKRATERKHALESAAKDAEYEQAKKERDARNAVLAADNQRLRGKLEQYASGSRHTGETDAAFAERLANRSSILGGLLAESIELSGEGESIIRRRDDEVKRLLDQINVDRAACSAE